MCWQPQRGKRVIAAFFKVPVDYGIRPKRNKHERKEAQKGRSDKDAENDEYDIHGGYNGGVLGNVNIYLVSRANTSATIRLNGPPIDIHIAPRRS